jgi:hypothetical protein
MKAFVSATAYQTRPEGQEHFKLKLYFWWLARWRGGAFFEFFIARELLAGNRELKAALTIANICKDQKISDEMNKMSALKQPDL